MCEKFNSGMGGYTCDYCGRLLWAGFNGKDNPENRVFIYSSGPEDTVAENGKVYCKDCWIEMHSCGDSDEY